MNYARRFFIGASRENFVSVANNFYVFFMHVFAYLKIIYLCLNIVVELDKKKFPNSFVLILINIS